VIIQYIQDLYRFFKISPFKNEFEDVFSGKMDLYYSGFFQKLVEDESILRNIGEYFFEKEHHEEALDIFNLQLEKDPQNQELLEKSGYALQKSGEFKKAIHYYRRIELSGSLRHWVWKNLGYCYRMSGNYTMALESYQEALEMKPDDPAVESMIGYCHLKLGDHDTALKHYFRLEYLNPGNQNVLRPIAWCYFVLGDLEKADKYFQQVHEMGAGYYDYMNYGHVLWSLGKRKEAIDQYIQSLNDENFTLDNFLKTMNEDKKLLISNGVNKNDIPLLIDYLHYKLSK
jgi:tetratricopeptide (TPR) repeat protein